MVIIWFLVFGSRNEEGEEKGLKLKVSLVFFFFFEGGVL